ncbi:hypothetical protein [Streptomyces albogriseolus]|uniref:hypothetical protein n=1 Tax=Streptomyces albogriseolus TaxID=1887 RepID=UPI0033BBD2B3
MRGAVGIHAPPDTHRATAATPSTTAGTAHGHRINRRAEGASHSAPTAPAETTAKALPSSIPPYAAWSQSPSGRMLIASQREERRHHGQQHHRHGEDHAEQAAVVVGWCGRSSVG